MTHKLRSEGLNIQMWERVVEVSPVFLYELSILKIIPLSLLDIMRSMRSSCTCKDQHENG